MKQEHFLSLAKQASRRSDHHTHKLGCVIAKGKKVLGTGFNVLKTHPKSPHNWKAVHAEFMAVMSAGYDVDGATAYIFRQQKNGTWAAAKPCESCWQFLVDCGVKEIVYSYEGSFRQEKIR